FYTTLPTSLSSTLSLHDALPIFPCNIYRSMRGSRLAGLLSYIVGNVVQKLQKTYGTPARTHQVIRSPTDLQLLTTNAARLVCDRSEEHTSELQSRGHLVCRLLLE